MWPVCDKKRYWLAAGVCIIILLIIQFSKLKTWELSDETFMARLIIPSSPQSSSGSCTCSDSFVLLKDRIPKDQYEEVEKRRAKAIKQHKARTTSVLSKLLFAAPNSPLQYPIQGFTVRPLTSTLIPAKFGCIKSEMTVEKWGASCQLLGWQTYISSAADLGRHLEVTLSVSKGVLSSGITPEGVTIRGDGERSLVLESSSLETLNNVLAKVSYTSTVYHIHTGDLAYFHFKDHQAVFPIAIKQPHVPVLYDMGTDINSHVTIVTKTFLRYPNLKVLLSSIRSFYKNMTVIIADDSIEPEPVTGEHIRHYIMPPAQGWFAGRNLAVSQVTTKYFLWVDDDYLFTEDTKIEKMVEIMEAVPELDVIGGSVRGNQFYFTIEYEEGDEMEGGCLYRKSNMKLLPLPGFPQCSLAHGVVNFFLARTDAVRKVGFDPKLQRKAHSEFFMDGLGSLMVATCGDVSIGHQPHNIPNKDADSYKKFREPPKSDEEFKFQLHYFKNHLKCIRFG